MGNAKWDFSQSMYNSVGKTSVHLKSNPEQPTLHLSGSFYCSESIRCITSWTLATEASSNSTLWLSKICQSSCYFSITFCLNPGFRVVLRGASLRHITRNLAKHRRQHCHNSTGKDLRCIPSMRCAVSSLGLLLL